MVFTFINPSGTPDIDPDFLAKIDDVSKINDGRLFFKPEAEVRQSDSEEDIVKLSGSGLWEWNYDTQAYARIHKPWGANSRTQFVDEKLNQFDTFASQLQPWMLDPNGVDPDSSILSSQNKKQSNNWMPELNLKNVALGVLAVGGLILTGGALLPEEIALFGVGAGAAEVGSLTAAELIATGVEAEAGVEVGVGAGESIGAWLEGSTVADETFVFDTASEATHTSYLSDFGVGLEESSTSNFGGIIRSGETQSEAAFESISSRSGFSTFLEDQAEGEAFFEGAAFGDIGVEASEFGSGSSGIFSEVSTSVEGVGIDGISAARRFTPANVGNFITGVGIIGGALSGDDKKPKRKKTQMRNLPSPNPRQRFDNTRFKTTKHKIFPRTGPLRNEFKSKAIKKERKFLPSV